MSDKPKIGDQAAFGLICQNMLPGQREAMADYFLGSEDQPAAEALIEAAVRAAILSNIPAPLFAAMVKEVWDGYAAHMNRGVQ